MIRLVCEVRFAEPEESTNFLDAQNGATQEQQAHAGVSFTVCRCTT